MNNSQPSPTELSPSAVSHRIRRRDLLAGGLGALGGVVAGAVAGAVAGQKFARVPDPEPQVEWREKPLPEWARVSYAQFGEDLVADSLLSSIKVAKPSYLDVGACDPVRLSNTYLFYLTGARGVLVEPNVALTERLRSERPGDSVLVAGIGTSDQSEADYYVMSAPDLNTFDKAQAERLHRDTVHKIVRVVKMPLLSINRVIAEHFGGVAPDFLSIDIEGMDYAVLKTLDYKRFRPKVICAETIITATLKENGDTTRLMTEHGYELRGMTLANTMYVDKKFLA